MKAFKAAAIMAGKGIRLGSLLKQLDFTYSYSTNASDYLNQPVNISGNYDVVHPSLLYFKNGWNGYKYWLGLNPYPAGSSDYENPSIVVSNDLATWVVPSGLTNPIATKPTVGYNSDVHLFMSADNTTMYCIWRERATNNPVKLLKSTDGVVWGGLKTIIQDSRDHVSPCVLYENGIYSLFSADISTNPNTFQLYQSANPEQEGWTFIQNIKFPTTDAGTEIWHFEIKKYLGTYIMLFDDTTINQSNTGRLWFSFTKNKLKWNNKTEIGRVSLGFNRFYKSTFILNESQSGFKIIAGAGYSRFINVDWYLTENPIKYDLINAITSASPPSSLVWDSFTRANGLIGTSTSGLAWVMHNGSFNIIDNAVGTNIAQNTKAFINTGLSNYDAAIEISKFSNQTWFIFRGANSLNYWRVGASLSVLTIEKITDGVPTSVANSYADVRDGDILRVVCNGNVIKVYINQNLVFNVTDSFLNTETNVGIQVNNTVSRFKNLLVKALV